MPSVFKLSLSMKRIRPRTLAGNPSMISTDDVDLALRAANGDAGRFLRKSLRRTNESSQRARRDDGGRTQIDECIAIAHPAFEIAIGRADGGLAFLHQTATEPDARATT